MGQTLLILFAITEIVLIVWTCKREKEKKDWRRNRAMIRLAQLVMVIAAILLPLGQKWRLVPTLVCVIVLLAIAAVFFFIRRQKEDGDKSTVGAIVSGILSVVLLGVSLIPAFLFTGYQGLPVTGEYQCAQASAILVDESRLDPFEEDGSYRELPVHFFYPKDAGDTRYPLVVFSHGAFGYYQSNMSTYQELVSHGYVVAALDYPHHAFFTHDTGGNLITVDPEYLQTAIGVSNEETQGEYDEYSLATEWMGLRVPDLNFVLDEITAAVQTDSFSFAWSFTDSDEQGICEVTSRIDVDKIGVMGHSMGGATSTEIGRERSDIDAVICIDGTMLGEYIGQEDGKKIVSENPYTVPILDFSNESEHQNREEYRTWGIAYPNNSVADNASEGIYTWVWIKGAEHMDFTDLPLLSPFLADLLASGDRDSKEIMTIVNSLILDFYDCHLKGEGEFTAQDSY